MDILIFLGCFDKQMYIIQTINLGFIIVAFFNPFDSRCLINLCNLISWPWMTFIVHAATRETQELLDMSLLYCYITYDPFGSITIIDLTCMTSCFSSLLR